ncbi:hypothetical protein VKT23_016958 [Stygiomarasmius scandens]|uniref:Heterokaryon incompatibility domain-containing protein n=1 Tax=Marasmiellus scandens TaxID=2682957 RepID=A0ABR1ITB3_9AGAR
MPNLKVPQDFRKLVFSSDFSLLKGTVLDISSSATPCRYRLIDVKSFLDDKQLRIYEFDDFPNTYNAYYSAISYVWQGNILVDEPCSPSYWEEELGVFMVKGAEDGDPISLDVLYHTCITALNSAPNAHYIWLDRLCILQTDKNDKAWQIRQMYEIYRYCKVCCILPGGIQRLVTLDEETTWIHRAWTLQEAIVPHRTIVIFMTDDERVDELRCASADAAIYNPVVDVIPGVSAYAQLRSLLELSMVNENASTCRIFGRKRAPRAALYGAAIKQQSHSYFERDQKEQAIWRSALMRTSSRPVDMVFSIMGIFGIFLDPLKFEKDDRSGATIALARKLVSLVGYKAHWMAMAYQLDPCRQISTFPEFPMTTVGGIAYFSMEDGTKREVADVVKERCDDGWLAGIPEGSMDEDGYFTFTSKAVCITPTESRSSNPISNPAFDRETGRIVVRAGDHSIWEIIQGPQDGLRTFAVYLGKQMSNSPDRHIALVVREHSPGRFHRVTYVKLTENFESFLEGLKAVTLSVGGPDAPSRAAQE